MKLLVLGGTQFVGRAIVDAAIARGHEVSLLTRGQTHPDLFPNAEKLRGDRATEEGLSALRGRRWDAAVDSCGYFPGDLRLSTKALKDSVQRYLFVSTVSVYSDFSKKGLDEHSPLGKTDDPETREITSASYGPLKVLCENVVQEIFGERATIVRPGIIAGPHDPTGRFTYWPRRLSLGGEVLAPGLPQQSVQVIDARDLGEFTVKLLETSTSGIFNAAGETVTFRRMLEEVREGVGGNATLTWVSGRFLEQQEVASSLPLWIPEDKPDYARIFDVDSSRALAAGLNRRPIHETAKDTMEWDRARPADERKDDETLTIEREHEVLRSWHKLSHPFRA